VFRFLPVVPRSNIELPPRGVESHRKQPTKIETLIVFTDGSFGLQAPALGTAAMLAPAPAPAQRRLERARGNLDGLKDERQPERKGPLKFNK